MELALGLGFVLTLVGMMLVPLFGPKNQPEWVQETVTISTK